MSIAKRVGNGVNDMDSWKVFAYLDIEKYKRWQFMQSGPSLATDPPREIHVIEDEAESEFVTIQWGAAGISQSVPRSVIYYANRYAQAIADYLVKNADKIENFNDVIRYLSADGNRFNLRWRDCEPFVLGAVRAIGNYLNVPHDVLLSDELLPAIAAILRDDDG